MTKVLEFRGAFPTTVVVLQPPEAFQPPALLFLLQQLSLALSVLDHISLVGAC